MVRKRMKNKPNKSKLNDVKIEIDRQKSEYENTCLLYTSPSPRDCS